ncbi:MAG: methyltransferase domain-containing protein [Acidobacteriota bacterium]
MEVERIFRDVVAAELARATTAVADRTGEFARGRLGEGRQLSAFLLPRFVRRPIRVLDLGAGNGGVGAAFTTDDSFRMVAADVVVNEQITSLRRAGVPLSYLAADGESLPFAGGSFDVVLCLETIEHVRNPGSLGREIMRVLSSGGLCMITTPARIRHLLGPDPHYGIRALLALPDGLQRVVGQRILGKDERYDVEHIFWHVRGVSRHFPGRARVETLCNIPYPGIARTLPQILWVLFRSVLWDRIIVHKG